MKRSIKILDTTLREGEQQPYVRFSKAEKIHLLKLLEQFQVDLIEVGHPAISPEDEEICRAVAQAAQTAQILMHARAVPAEIDTAYKAGADWIGIWSSINQLSLETKYNRCCRKKVIDKIRRAIHHAKHLGLQVRFTIEDASRTRWSDLAYLCQIALEEGADRISLADTTGIWDPSTCGKIVKRVIDTFPCELEVHLHNDLGLALANAAAAMDAGAHVIDASILGIGERSGIVDLLELSVLLHVKYNDHRFPLTQIPALSQAVQVATGYRPDSLRPIVGQNAFTHTAKYHVKAVQKNPKTYEPYPPSLVGRSRRLISERSKYDASRLPLLPKVGKPFIKGASELKYHRDGPGLRWVHMDSRVDPRTTFYVIQRMFTEECLNAEKHVDSHVHHCDSLFLFFGDAPDGTGLTCAVLWDEEEIVIDSPASIFIPAGVKHAYYYLKGKGVYTNIVLSPDYNQSLL